MSTPWEQLISSTMTPTTAVAVKLAVTDEPPEPADPKGCAALPGEIAADGGAAAGLLGTLHRHIPLLARLSLNKTAAGTTHCRSVPTSPSYVRKSLHANSV